MSINKLVSLLISTNKQGLTELYQLFENKDYDTIIRILYQFLMIGDYNTITDIIYDNMILNIIPKHTDMKLYNSLFECYYSCNHDGLLYNYKNVKPIKVYILKKIVNNINEKTFDKYIFQLIKSDSLFSVLILDVINHIHNRKKRREFINMIINNMVKRNYNIYSNVYLFQMGIYNKKWYYCDDYNADKIIRTMV